MKGRRRGQTIAGRHRKAMREALVEREYAQAYLTIYLALSLAIMLSLFLTLLEGARMNAIRMKIECTADISLNSVLAEFHRALYEQYDLFYVDTSYGTGSPSLGQTQQHLKQYIDKNYQSSRTDLTSLQAENAEIINARYIQDQEGQSLRQQIYAYMTAHPGGELAGEFLTKIDQFQGLKSSESAWQEQRIQNEEELAWMEPPTETDEEGNEREVPIENPAEAVNSFRQQSVLTQIFGSASLSEASLEEADRPSVRGLSMGSGWEAENTHGYPEADALLFDQYVFEKCGNYRNPLEKSCLKYQIEYMIYGNPSDKENLSDMATALLAVREAANLTYLFTDAGKAEEADAMAAVLAAVILLPALQPLIKTAILFAWAYLESVQDVKTLFAGGKVPMLKDASTWRTSLAGILAPGSSTSGQSGGNGLGYEEYLRIMLYLQDGNTKNARLLDLMESDIRQTQGNDSFRIDGCIDSLEARIVTKSRFGYEYTIEHAVSYN